MSKKPKRRKQVGGWSKARTGRADDRKARIARRIMDTVAKDSMSPEDLNRLAAELFRLLRTWPELRMVRAPIEGIPVALEGISAADEAALADPFRGTARARRARGRVYPKLFDDAFVGELAVGLEAALGRAQSQQDIEAIALAIALVRETTLGRLPMGNSPLFAMLAALSFQEVGDLRAGLDQLAQLDEAAEDGTPASADERQQRLGEIMAAHPAIQRYFYRQMLQDIVLLAQRIISGDIQARLTRDEVGHLTEPMERAVRPGEANRQPPSAEVVQARKELEQALNDFANSPANKAAFARFTAALEAEAREALAAGQPRAEEVERLASAWKRLYLTAAVFRVAICHASVLRLVRGAAGRADAPPPDDRPPPQSC